MPKPTSGAMARMAARHSRRPALKPSSCSTALGSGWAGAPGARSGEVKRGRSGSGEIGRGRDRARSGEVAHPRRGPTRGRGARRRWGAPRAAARAARLSAAWPPCPETRAPHTLRERHINRDSARPGVRGSQVGALRHGAPARVGEAPLMGADACLEHRVRRVDLRVKPAAEGAVARRGGSQAHRCCERVGAGHKVGRRTAAAPRAGCTAARPAPTYPQRCRTRSRPRTS